MNVEQRMTRTPWSCHRDDTLEQAARLLWEHDCGALPVIGESGRLLGMLTDRDICMAAYTTGQSLAGVRVNQAMASHIASVRPDTSLRDAERTMRERRVHRLPVVDEHDQLVGILTTNDLLRWGDAGATRGPSPDDAARLVRTLATIGTPRPAGTGNVAASSASPPAVMSPLAHPAKGTMLTAMSRAVATRARDLAATRGGPTRDPAFVGPIEPHVVPDARGSPR